MNFQHNDHTRDYFYRCKKLSQKLREFDWESTPGFGINLSRGDDNLDYQFLKFSTKLFTKVERTHDDEINLFLNDPNILSLGVINVAAKSEVQIHKDHDYWSALFHRIHIPLNSTGAFFIYGDEEIVWQFGEIYIFDVMGVPHGAINRTDQDFKMVYVDITQNPVDESKKSRISSSSKEYQEKVFNDIAQDLILKEKEKSYVKEELEVLEQHGYTLHSNNH